MNPDKPVVFFDGYCGLCNSLVDFLVRKDKNRKLYFAPLQGHTASQLLTVEDTQHLDTLVLFDFGKKYYRSDAVIRIFQLIGRGWGALVVFKILPRFIRNSFYNIISENRYNWFGKKETCRFPTLEERKVILK